MWVRQSHSKTTKANSEAYLTFLQTVAVPRHKAATGNLNAHALRTVGILADDFCLFSYWRSLETLQVFERDDARLTEPQGTVFHQLEAGRDVLIYQPFDIDDYQVHRKEK